MKKRYLGKAKLAVSAIGWAVWGCRIFMANTMMPINCHYQ